MKTKETPYGDQCVGDIELSSNLGTLIQEQAHGTWQREVTDALARNGYVIGYRAAGTLRGKAASYMSKYQRSLDHLMNRISDALYTESPYRLRSGGVGPKGGFGWYIE